MPRTLRDYLKEKAPLPPARALELFRILAGACAAQGDAPVGRRLRPEAIEMDPAGRPLLGTRSVTSPYDDLYLSGDIRRGEMPDVRVDLFALGVILFEALTGRRPDPWESPGEVRPGIPEAADALYRGCTAPLPRRFASWREALATLEAGRPGGRPGSPGGHATPGSPGIPQGDGAWAPAAWTLVGAAAGFGGVVAWLARWP